MYSYVRPTSYPHCTLCSPVHGYSKYCKSILLSRVFWPWSHGCTLNVVESAAYRLLTPSRPCTCEHVWAYIMLALHLHAAFRSTKCTIDGGQVGKNANDEVFFADDAPGVPPLELDAGERNLAQRRQRDDGLSSAKPWNASREYHDRAGTRTRTLVASATSTSPDTAPKPARTSWLNYSLVELPNDDGPHCAV